MQLFIVNYDVQRQSRPTKRRLGGSHRVELQYVQYRSGLRIQRVCRGCCGVVALLALLALLAIALKVVRNIAARVLAVENPAAQI